MRFLSLIALSLPLTCVSVSAQAQLMVSHLDANFSWSPGVVDATHDPATEHVLTCGVSVVTVPMPNTSIPVRNVVPGPGIYSCTLYAQNSAGRQADPDVPFPQFQSGYIPGIPFQLQVLDQPGTGVPTMASPVFQSVSNTSYATRTNTTVTAPSGIQDGDVLLFSLFVGGSSPVTATPPSGFALPSGGTWPISVADSSGFDGRRYVWYKIASGESGNYTATHASGWSQGVMVRISGGDGAQPLATTNDGIGSTSTFTGLTTTTDGAMVIIIGTDWNDSSNNLSPPSGTTPTFTERLDVAPLHYVATGIMTTAGATGNKTMTTNSNSDGPWTAVMLAINGTAGGGGSSLLIQPRPMSALLVR